MGELRRWWARVAAWLLVSQLATAPDPAPSNIGAICSTVNQACIDICQSAIECNTNIFLPNCFGYIPCTILPDAPPPTPAATTALPVVTATTRVDPFSNGTTYAAITTPSQRDTDVDSSTISSTTTFTSEPSTTELLSTERLPSTSSSTGQDTTTVGVLTTTRFRINGSGNVKPSCSAFFVAGVLASFASALPTTL